MQWQFNTAVEKNDAKTVAILLKHPEVNPADDYNFAIIESIESYCFDVFKLLLNDKRVNPSDDYNNAIRYASSSGYIEFVKLLLEHSRVNPSDLDNEAIKEAHNNNHYDIVNLLWKNKKVQNTLQNDAPELYYNLMSLDVEKKVTLF
jgi:hypothetical protein